MTHSFLRACLIFLAGVVTLWIALQVLAQIWMWLVLIGALVGVGYLAYRLVKARQNRW